MTKKLKIKDKIKSMGMIPLQPKKIKVKLNDGNEANFESVHQAIDQPTIDLEKVEPVRRSKVKLTVEELFVLTTVNERITLKQKLKAKPLVLLDTVPYISFVEDQRISLIGQALDFLSLNQFQNIEVRYIKNNETRQKALYLTGGVKGKNSKYKRTSCASKNVNIANTKLLKNLFGGVGNYNRNQLGTKYIAEKATIEGVDYLYVNLYAQPLRRLKKKKS